MATFNDARIEFESKILERMVKNGDIFKSLAQQHTGWMDSIREGKREGFSVDSMSELSDLIKATRCKDSDLNKDSNLEKVCVVGAGKQVSALGLSRINNPILISPVLSTRAERKQEYTLGLSTVSCVHQQLKSKKNTKLNVPISRKDRNAKYRGPYG